MRLVRERISLHKEQFVYSHYFRPANRFESGVQLKKLQDCGTLACVAGWTCYTLEPELTIDDACYKAGMYAQELLELNTPEASFLFHHFSDSANADDALARIDWLLADKPILDYDFRQESWAKDYGADDPETFRNRCLNEMIRHEDSSV